MRPPDPADPRAAPPAPFVAALQAARPDLHRYASRLVGSALDGEDVVQEALAKAVAAADQAPDAPTLRPWLFRITRNAAIDHLRRTRSGAVPTDEVDAMPADETVDPYALRAALSAFLALPVRQRSAVILKDVLGEPLESIAEHLDLTVEAVKALLVRGRATLATHATPDAAPPPPPDREALGRYVALFNQRDWDGVRAMLVEDVQLDLVSVTKKRGAEVGVYFGRYAQEQGLTFTRGRCEGRDAVGVFRDGALVYVILVRFEGGRVTSIKDFRYVPYLARELTFEAAE